MKLFSVRETSQLLEIPVTKIQYALHHGLIPSTPHYVPNEGATRHHFTPEQVATINEIWESFDRKGFRAPCLPTTRRVRISAEDDAYALARKKTDLLRERRERAHIFTTPRNEWERLADDLERA